jgi:hypothetical protein
MICVQQTEFSNPCLRQSQHTGRTNAPKSDNGNDLRPQGMQLGDALEQIALASILDSQAPDVRTCLLLVAGLGHDDEQPPVSMPAVGVFLRKAYREQNPFSRVKGTAQTPVQLRVLGLDKT